MFDAGKSLSITDIVNVGGDKKEEAMMVDKKANIITENDVKEALSANLASNEAMVGSDFKPSLSGSGFRVDLHNDDGNGYVGTIYIGSEDRPAKVLFDTGSDFLAITSDLCNDPKLGK